MSANSFGNRFIIHSFGESHGEAIGVVIDGCPAALDFDFNLLKNELERRRPGSHSKTASTLVSMRQELDFPEILSGVYNGKTLGTPIAIIVRNQDARSKDYESVIKKPRKGHADLVWKEKFLHWDPRGGGRSSGRETVARVMGGAVAKMLLQQLSTKTRIKAFVSQVGDFELSESEEKSFLKSKKAADSFPLRFPSKKNKHAVAFLENLKKKGDSVGGVACVVIQKPPKNLGQPVFHKLKADLASAFMGIGASCAVELGSGFQSSLEKGSTFHRGRTSVYGGINGGVSNGEDIILKIAFKPTSSIFEVAKKGRHDPCIVTRAIPVLESMAALVLVDHLLWRASDHI